jgi:hypothetical protein
MTEKAKKVGIIIILFIFSFMIVLPFNLVLISPYYETTKSIDIFFIIAIGAFVVCLMILSDEMKEFNILKKIMTMIISGIVVSLFMVAFKSPVINLVTNLIYFDLNLIANNHEKIKITQPYKDFELAFSTKDKEYLQKYFKENIYDNFSEINDKDKYDLVTYVKVLNDPVVNQEFKKIYEDEIITRKEYVDFQKFTIENAKNIQ